MPRFENESRIMERNNDSSFVIYEPSSLINQVRRLSKHVIVQNWLVKEISVWTSYRTINKLKSEIMSAYSFFVVLASH